MEYLQYFDGRTLIELLLVWAVGMQTIRVQRYKTCNREILDHYDRLCDTYEKADAKRYQRDRLPFHYGEQA